MKADVISLDPETARGKARSIGQRPVVEGNGQDVKEQTGYEVITYIHRGVHTGQKMAACMDFIEALPS